MKRYERKASYNYTFIRVVVVDQMTKFMIMHIGVVGQDQHHNKESLCQPLCF